MRAVGRSVLAVLALVVLAGLVACSSSDSSDSDVAGVWNGRRFNNDGSSNFTMSLSQNGSTVSGSYADGGWSGVISGQVDGDNVTLSLTLTTVPPGSPMGIWTFTGTVSGNGMSGALQAGANQMNWTATRV